MKLPHHLAIIMDGNGRWAQALGRQRAYGHMRGARVAKNIITAAAQRDIKNLTLFTFSTENWARPQLEVDFLMRLLAHQIKREQRTLMENNIRFHTIGSLERLPSAARQVVLDTARLTEKNTGMNLVFALNYGGRQEIVQAAKRIAELAREQKLNPEDVDDAFFAHKLESSFLPAPDLIIRTSGEHRLSNFFLWQAAYSEFFVLDKMWPDFTANDLDLALNNYATRSRRFGKIHAVEKRAEA
jgi:undecaprenyl diphosphate synthase